jgi:hypothetical protein
MTVFERRSCRVGGSCPSILIGLAVIYDCEEETHDEEEDDRSDEEG